MASSDKAKFIDKEASIAVDMECSNGAPVFVSVVSTSNLGIHNASLMCYVAPLVVPTLMTIDGTFFLKSEQSFPARPVRKME
mgnify:CR=1 FL=1